MNYRLIAARVLTVALTLTTFAFWFISIWAADARAGWSVIPCAIAASLSGLLLIAEEARSE